MTATLVQVFLPLYDNDGVRLPRALYVRTYQELTQRYGGVTAFTRSPASGLWSAPDDEIVEDAVMLIEVMVERLDRAWWQEFKMRLEQAFRQESILIRALGCEPL